MASSTARNLVVAFCGAVFLIVGIVLVLREWANLLIVFKGVVGGLLAVVGIFMLFLVGGKSGKS